MGLYNSCSLYGNSEETQEHLFIHCKVTSKLWQSLILRDNIAWGFPNSFTALAHVWDKNIFSSSGNFIWEMIPAAIVWVIWRERNCRTFEEDYDYNTDIDLVVDAKSLLLSWAAAAGRTVHLTLLVLSLILGHLFSCNF